MPSTPSCETLPPNDSLRLNREELQEALTAHKDQLFMLIQKGREEVLLAVLRNPHLDHQHLLALLKRRDLGTVIAAINADSHFMAIHAVKCAVAAHPDTPPQIAQTLLSLLYILDLLKLCRIPGVTPDVRVAAERKIIQQIPTQPLGNKIALARQGTSAILDSLLREGVPRVLETCLDNPHLKEGSLYQFLISHHANAANVSLVANNSRWKNRPNIRLAILKNPRTPMNWFTTFLPGLSPSTLRDLLAAPRLTAAQKELIRQAGRHTHI
jgi:hypothetical protein